MTAPSMRRRLAPTTGFTLVEVLFATSITAILMAAITLNLSIRPSLVTLSTAPSTTRILSARVNEILRELSPTELEAIAAGTSNISLSDPVGAEHRKVVSITPLSVGSDASTTTVLSLQISSGSEQFTRWITPLDMP